MRGERLPSPLRHRDYWLCRCQDFRVEAANRCVGRVAELRYRSRVDRPDALAIRVRRFGRRLLVVPVEEIVDIDPAGRRISLRAAPPVKGRLRLLRSLSRAERADALSREAISSSKPGRSCWPTRAPIQRALARIRAASGDRAVTAPFDLSGTRKEVRREMSAETEEPARTAEETAEEPAAEETAEEPAAEETADETAADETAEEGS
jgi:hypothetical protein